MRFQYRRVALTISMIVMGIGMITLSTGKSGGDDSTTLENNQEQENQILTEADENLMPEQPEVVIVSQPAISDTVDPTEDEMVETVVLEKVLEKDAYPEINELITAYLNAKLDCDEVKLAELVDDVTYLDMKDIQRRTERIEEYTKIECYTLDGPEEGSYMVYVYSEVKVNGIDTLASGLDGFYIRTDEMGKMTITLGEVSDEVAAELSEDAVREDVQQLIMEVNEKFTREVESDEKLAEYYEELRIVEALEEKERQEVAERAEIEEKAEEE